MSVRRQGLYAVISGVPYSIFMVICIIISIVPLAFHTENNVFTMLDVCCAFVFLLDYAARWLTADFADSRKYPFLRYPFLPMTVIDLLSVLPTVTALGKGFKLLKLVRMMRMLRIFRTLKLMRYSRNMRIIHNVFQKQRDSLLTVCALAFAYIIISALVVFNVEPETFPTFYEAVYWAAVSLTTVGYGDIYPVTPVGRLVTMLSSMLGIAVVALPAGIVTAGYMQEIAQQKDEKQK